MNTPPPNLNLPTKLVDGLQVPILDKPYTQILAAIEAGGTLNMDWWHGVNRGQTPNAFCGTMHCIAGWATHLCGAQGADLEMEMGCTGYAPDTLAAAVRILEASSDLQTPGFDPFDYDEYGELSMDEINDLALEAIRRLAAQEAQS